MRWCLTILLFASPAYGQQATRQNVVDAYRTVLPKTDDPMLQEILDRGVFYTSSLSDDPSLAFSNARVFPWRQSLGGGSHFGGNRVRTAKVFLSDEPIAVFGSRNQHWCYPTGAAVAELAFIIDDDGAWHPFETRRRLREPDDWETDIVEPFPTREKLVAAVAKTHPEIAEQIPDMPIRKFTIAARQPRASFREVVKLQRLPPFPLELKRRLLMETVHESSAGVEYADDCDGFYQNTDDFHIRPRMDVSAVNGNGERESCRNCHQDIKHQASDFGIIEPWDIRGGDGVFSIRPVTPGGQLRATWAQRGLAKRWLDIPDNKRHHYQQSVFLIDEVRQAGR